MNTLIIFWGLLCILNAVYAASTDDSTIREWRSFKNHFSKSYKSKSEEEIRSKVFKENKRLIDRHNEKFRKGEVTYEMELNEFSDWSDEEFFKMMKLDVPKLKNLESINDTIFYKVSSGFTAPSSVDWRDKGAVNKVRHQGSCGSCWAFSAVGALEGQYFKKNGKLISLSEQNLVDCSSSYGNHACNGGWMSSAFDYVRDHGISTAASYPYKGRVGRCRRDLENNSGVQVKSYKRIPSGNEEALKNAVATIGPIAVAFDCRRSFQSYKRGIYYEPSCSSSSIGNTGHAVLVVGYGTENNQDYWLVKNSWGANWGTGGYIKMARNRRNNCAIASFAVYPIV